MRSAIVLWTLLAALFIISCKKEKTTAPGTNRLQGDWEAAMEINTDYSNDTLTSRDTTIFAANEIVFSFTDDSLFLYENGVPDDDKYSYTVNGDDLVLRAGSEGHFFTLKWYSDNRMSYSVDDTWFLGTGVKRRSVDETIFNRK